MGRPKKNVAKVNETIDKAHENSVEPKVRQPKPSDLAPSKLAPSRQRREIVPKWQQKRLGVKNPDPNIHYHLANDKDGNIDKMLKAGYRPVMAQTEDDLRGIHSSNQEGALATQDVGQGLKAIWMGISKEEWERQQREKSKQNDFVDDILMRNAQSRDYNGVKNNRFYLKKDGDQ